MTCMEDLSYEYKLPGRSIARVHERFSNALARHQSIGKTKFRGRKLSAEGMVNAIMLRFLDLTFQDQAKVLAAYVPKFEALMERGANDFDPVTGEETPSIEDFVPEGNTTDNDWNPPDSFGALPADPGPLSTPSQASSRRTKAAKPAKDTASGTTTATPTANRGAKGGEAREAIPVEGPPKAYTHRDSSPKSGWVGASQVDYPTTPKAKRAEKPKGEAKVEGIEKGGKTK
jgi:hypothetical protein